MPKANDERIKGKVAAILSVRELILNVGSKDGVEIGMKFVILNTKGVDVTDPDTGKVLGTVEVPKTVIKIVRVDGEHLSVGRTFRTVKGTPDLFSFTSQIRGTPDRPETLEIKSGTDLRAELPESESYVKRGDVAVSTSGDEYDYL